VELVSFQNDRDPVHPRFFKYKPGGPGCGHWAAHGDGGGPVSDRHLWLQNHLAGIVRDLGYTATCEHPQTRADVFVHEPSYCLEIQLRATDFTTRTRARQDKGTDVCWLIGDDVNSPSVKKGLFRGPAVRVQVVDRSSGRAGPAPWEWAVDSDADRQAQIRVYATVASWSRPVDADGTVAEPTSAADWFRTGSMDAVEFLAQVLSGERTWVPGVRVGKRFGVWALGTDLDAYENWQRTRWARARPATVAEVPAPTVPKPVTDAGEDVPEPEHEPGTPPAPTIGPVTPVIDVPPSSPTPGPTVVLDRVPAVATPRRRRWQLWRSNSR
jgi:hypothetical protein